MEQVIRFNPTAGGKTPNMCLANVCAGFSIPNKYDSAWEAWEHTVQHTDPVPSDLDVPVFFSYTATIDGVNQNWGHIGVRLASGQFWSDGNIYQSIDEYMVNHWPKYVGWGESINDVQIIKEGDDMFKGRTAAQWAEIATKNQVALDAANNAVKAARTADLFKNRTAAQWAEIATKNQVALDQANAKLQSLNQAPVSSDKAELDQINANVSWIRALLSKVFK